LLDEEIMSHVPFKLSQRAYHTDDQPISYFMQQAVENPGLISLAAGLVDPESLPAEDVRIALDEILSDPRAAQAALQYGTTQGYAPLREKILGHVVGLDRMTAQEMSIGSDDIVITTGSQQLLYLLGELLFDPGDIVITEAPSYFVYHGVLSSLGLRVLAVPMDEDGMITDALEELLGQLERAGDLERVKLIYTVDYYQNPSGLTLSLPRRQHLLELARRFSRRQRLFVLEDAAYRELRFDGPDVPSIKSLDRGNEHVILTMTFSKPAAPGLKTGYGVLPRALVAPLARFKGNHDFGSSNLNQHIIDRLMASGAYHRHVRYLAEVYRHKRDVLVSALAEEFPAGQCGVRWTHPDGGLYVWLRCPPALETGPGSRFMQAALEQGVLYVPGSFCYVRDEDGRVPNHEARLCYATATAEQLREAVRRLGRAARAALPVSAGQHPEVGHARNAMQDSIAMG
jgi:2-aminoadipate transaminase